MQVCSWGDHSVVNPGSACGQLQAVTRLTSALMHEACSGRRSALHAMLFGLPH